MSTYPASNIIVFDQNGTQYTYTIIKEGYYPQIDILCYTSSLSDLGNVPTSKIFGLRFLNERRWELELGDVSRTFTNVSSFFLTVNLLLEHFERFDWDFT
ncbi:hypothetical protein RhiirC2_798726 [Rhizophagus irregularis]|uniref:Uncharacterized protein n=1 Tax=Rhizophagus irregularis TaxID=588596 RepID=A0A2N1M605_9GLOM|nr:hypothetical protein RhiirC2_799599 [Rhizophagus irregularis]PKK56670.1 hypothetical protein RhiirC2_799548 [Rhizophagus irregularis]PKK57065.1 hypothetical protein RhiirC2_798726 [Rhizophagus irregularis]